MEAEREKRKRFYEEMSEEQKVKQAAERLLQNEATL